MAADFEQVKQNIADTIYENGEELITGQVMQDRLLEMVSVTEEAINDVTIDPTVNVTVNNTTGTPSGSASFQNNQFSFEFSGIKGETGNSGYTGAAGELEVVNNLTSDDATAALSAYQGKVLDGKVTQLGQERNLSDAVLAIRAQTSSHSTEDNPSGTRIRIIFPVREGEVVKYSTSLSSGINGAIYDSIPNAVYSSATVGKLQVLNTGYTTNPVTAVSEYDGYLVLSLTNGTTAISDARKSEMLAATSVELLYNPGKAISITEDSIVTLAGNAITNPRSAWYVIRRPTGGAPLLNDDPSGVRLRVIQPVKPGDVIWAYSTDAGGVSAGIWDTPENAARAAAAGMVEWIVSGYTTKEIFHVVKTAGYATISLTNGSTAINDARKEEMLDSLQVFIGSIGIFQEKMLPIASAFVQHSDKYVQMSGNYIGERPALGKYHVSDFGALDAFIGTQPSTIFLQGMGLSSPYLFWGSESGSTRQIVVLNLETREILGTIMWSEEGDWHMNNINVSAQRYNASDKFPLIYLSECRGVHRCAVLKIADGAASYTVIQMLTFADASTYFLDSHDWFLDEANGAIYAFGTSISGATTFKVVKFALPALSSAEVTFLSSDVIESWDIPDVDVYQGSVVINGRLYIPYGFGTSGSPCRMKIVDLVTKQTVTSIPLYQTFGNVEIEGVAAFEDGIMISGGGSSGRLYKIVFD